MDVVNCNSFLDSLSVLEMFDISNNGYFGFLV